MSDLKPPQKIYLQDYCEDYLSEGNTTWCDDKQNDDDIEYILQSEYDQLKAENDQLRADNERLREVNEFISDKLDFLADTLDTLYDLTHTSPDRHDVFVVVEQALKEVKE